MIPKIIHIAWKDKNILNNHSIFVRNCIGSLVELATGWVPVISDDSDIDQYLKKHLSMLDYSILHNRHIVEKTDVWRLLKLYIEGGLYVDIDRLCNTSLNSIINKHTQIVLPVCVDNTFSQDFMCSVPNNPIFLETLHLNLQRRRNGITNIYLLGPQTYFQGVSKSLTGKVLPSPINNIDFKFLLDLISNNKSINTYIETPPYNTIMYRPENMQVSFDHEEEKRKFYAQSNIRHWTNEW
jgi:hypothetical protein